MKIQKYLIDYGYKDKQIGWNNKIIRKKSIKIYGIDD